LCKSLITFIASFFLLFRTSHIRYIRRHSFAAARAPITRNAGERAFSEAIG